MVGGEAWSRAARYIFKSLVAMVLYLLAGGGVHAATDRVQRILVMPHAGEEQALRLFHGNRTGKVVRKFQHLGGLQVIEVPEEESVEELLKAYRRSGLVEYVERDCRYRIAGEPDDPKFLDGTLWAWDNPAAGESGGEVDINAREAWNLVHEASEVIVAVIDTGIRTTHEDLGSNLWTNFGEVPGNGIDDDDNGIVDDVHGMDAIGNTGNPRDENGHGTHVAGILGAVGDNGRGVVGTAWDVRIMPLKFMGKSGDGLLSDALQCVDYAREHGASILNLSWVGSEYSLSLRRALQRADEAGILSVAAAGNSGRNIDGGHYYPANYPVSNLLTVTAVDRRGALPSFANYGIEAVDLAAPGKSIYSTAFAGDTAYEYRDGTSMAVPMVCGTLALMRVRFPEWSSGELIDRLLETVQPRDSLQGAVRSAGILDMEAALRRPFVVAFSALPETGDLPLTVGFADLTEVDVARRVWNFGDGTSAVEQVGENQVAHTFRRPGAFDVVLAVEDREGTIRTGTQTIQVRENFRVRIGNYSWLDPANRTAVERAGSAAVVELPFAFPYFGQLQDHLFMSPYGMAGFQLEGMKNYQNTPIPDTAKPNGVFYPYWDFLDPAAGGQMWYGWTGDPPWRQFVVSWEDVLTRARPEARLTFQVVLEETSGRVRFHYRDVDAANSKGAGREATVGLEDYAGQGGRQYSYNGTSLLSDGMGLVFDPPPVTILEISGENELEFSLDAAGGLHPEYQTLHLHNHANVPLSWLATVNAEWIQLKPSTGLLPPGEIQPANLSINFLELPESPGPYTGIAVLTSDQDPHRKTILEVRFSRGSEPVIQVASLSPEFELILYGLPGHYYEIQDSIDLDHWEPAFRGPADDNGRIRWIVSSQKAATFRFFRAIAME